MLGRARVAVPSYGTLGPVAVFLGAQLEGMGLSGRLDYRVLMASDLQGQGRAFRQVRDEGCDESEARAPCGFDWSAARRSGSRIPPVMQNTNRRVEVPCGPGRRPDGSRMGRQRAFQPAELFGLRAVCRNGRRSVPARLARPARPPGGNAPPAVGDGTACVVSWAYPPKPEPSHESRR